MSGCEESIEEQAQPAAKRIAIIGGGMGGLAAAFALTAPEVGGRYKVTVYQEGWLLGGKCSSTSNRNVDDRNEEHGLHVLMGFYVAVRQLMEGCFAELKLRKIPGAFEFDKLFSPRDKAVFYELYGGKWLPWPVTVPGNNRTIYDPMLPPVQLAMELAGRLNHWISTHATFAAAPAVSVPFHLTAPLQKIMSAAQISVGIQQLGSMHLPMLLEQGWKLAAAHVGKPGPAATEHRDALVFLADELHKFLEAMKPAGGNHTHSGGLDCAGTDLPTFFRRAWELLSLGTAALRGLASDIVFGAGFDGINSMDLMEWFRSHGAIKADSPAVRAFYGAAFAFAGPGNTSPNMAAGVGLKIMLRLFLDGRGAFMFAPNYGMGEALFAPLYLLLKERGVDFKFFQRADRLKLSTDRSTVEEVEFVVQAKYSPDYPFVKEQGGIYSWSSEPEYKFICEPKELATYQPIAHQEWPNAPEAGRETIRKGTHFDALILAVPPPVLDVIGPELRQAVPAFDSMMNNTNSVETIGVQLWFRRSLEELGWNCGPAVVGAYATPLDTWADMSQLLPKKWKFDPDRAQTLVYLCGIRDFQAKDQADALDRAKSAAGQWILNASSVPWPQANVGTVKAPTFDDLYVPPGARTNDRLSAQYFNANVAPSDRYIQSFKDTIHTRLHPGHTGFTDVYIAGDWVRTALSAGALEAATMGGLAAARSISGFPATIPGNL